MYFLVLYVLNKFFATLALNLNAIVIKSENIYNKYILTFFFNNYFNFATQMYLVSILQFYFSPIATLSFLNKQSSCIN